MNKKFLTISAVAFIIGLSANYALSNFPVSFSIATVDVQKVVSGSSQVIALKEDQKKKGLELETFAKNARDEVAKETDKTKQQVLEDKYNKQLNDMKKSMDEDYRKKLNAIDTTITAAIQKKAKEANYNIVLSKNIVLYGGTEITKEVSKLIK